MKVFSEEGLESCNKHIRRYREMLARKTNFQDNIHDVFVRLLCQSNYVIMSHSCRGKALKMYIKTQVIQIMTICS